MDEKDKKKIFDFFNSLSKLDNNDLLCRERNKYMQQKKLEELDKTLLRNVAENIKKSERLRCEINKDILEGKDILEILVKAIQCISLMTGDTVFYKQSIARIKTRTSDMEGK